MNHKIAGACAALLFLSAAPITHAQMDTVGRSPYTRLFEGTLSA